MAIVVPDNDRVIIANDGAKLRITMRVTNSPVITTVFGLFLAFWAFSEVSGVIVLLNGAPLEGMSFNIAWMTDKTSTGRDFTYFMLSWLALGAVPGVLFASLFLWNLAGKEIIELDSTTLKRIRQIPLFRHSKEYPIANVPHLRPTPVIEPPRLNGQKMSLLNFIGGTIAFDYGRRTHYLGSDLEEGDARYVIDEMCRRVKSLCR